MSFQPPDIRVTRVNLKPILPNGSLEGLKPERVLKPLARELKTILQKHILQQPFSRRAKVALRDGMEVKVGPKSVTVVALHPAFRPLLEGQKSKQMQWLAKAKAPIPMIDENGDVFFRSATPRSMLNGSWYHPGRRATTVIEDAKKEARELMKKRAKDVVRRHLRSSIARAR